MIKNTLIALALAVITVSGSTMAWAINGTGGVVTLGGTIIADKRPVWLVEMGSDHTEWSVTQSDFSEGVLTIAVQSPVPLIKIKTNNAYTAEGFANGTVPSMIVSGGDGAPIKRQFKGTAELSFTLPVYLNGGTHAAGTMTVENARVAGLVYGAKNNSVTHGIVLAVSNEGNNPLSLFAGAVGGAGEATGVPNTVNHFSLMGVEYLIPEAQALVGNTYTSWANQNWFRTFHPGNAIAKFNTENMSKAAMIFAMGLTQESTITLAFSQEITATSTWRAPIEFTVSYN